MTKFDSEAIGVRAGRQKGGLPTQKERKKEMEQFLKTGVHATHEAAKATPAIPTLPERDPHRPHVFMDFRIGPQALERILIEVFEDRVPLAARYFLNRCREGTHDCYQGTKVHRLVQDQGVFGGLAKGQKDASASIKRNTYLQHVDRGTVSVSHTGSEYVVALSRALTLNASHQVVGRVHKGHATLEQLNTLTVDDERPDPAVVLSACGLTNAQGDHESLEEAARRAAQLKADPQAQAKQLQAQALEARNATKEALQSALSLKRKAGAEPVQHATAKRPFLYDDDLSDDLSCSDDDGANEENGQSL